MTTPADRATQILGGAAPIIAAALADHPELLKIVNFTYGTTSVVVHGNPLTLPEFVQDAYARLDWEFRRYNWGVRVFYVRGTAEGRSYTFPETPWTP